MLLQKRIFEWSKTLPPWQRDLLRRLAAGPLDEAGQLDVLNILANAPDAPTPVPIELKDLPADEGEHGRVELRAVRDLRNINCLAPGQNLTFEPGLNAVFGDNGTGKSGYGRLARRVTRSGESDEILRDVFDPGSASGPQTADFDITVDEVNVTITVDLSSDPDRILSAMAAFDASRAQVFLTKPNVIEHVPRPLRLLRLLSNAQDRLAESLRERAQQRRAALPALPEISLSTMAGRALAELNADTDTAAFISHAALSDPEKATLHELEASAAAIGTNQGQQLEAAARAQAASTWTAVRALTEADAQLSVAAVKDLAKLRRRVDELTAAERVLADRAFADQRFDATGQGPLARDVVRRGALRGGERHDLPRHRRGRRLPAVPAGSRRHCPPAPGELQGVCEQHPASAGGGPPRPDQRQAQGFTRPQEGTRHGARRDARGA